MKLHLWRDVKKRWAAELATKTVDTFRAATGQRWIIHGPATCRLPCPFHGPSDHHMKSWKIVIRETTLVERLCRHGVGHPDPDSMWYLEQYGPEGARGTWGVHGCCGCCEPPSETLKPSCRVLLPSFCCDDDGYWIWRPTYEQSIAECGKCGVTAQYGDVLSWHFQRPLSGDS